MKNKKTYLTISIILIFFILLYFVPTRSEEYIKYSSPMEDGGPLYKAYYNIYNIKIRDEMVQVKERI